MTIRPIPRWFWKVAVIVPHGRKLADIQSDEDLQIIAVLMPNVASVNSDWTTYKTTVDAIEALSGYDLLNALPDDIEAVVERVGGYAKPDEEAAHDREEFMSFRVIVIVGQ